MRHPTWRFGIVVSRFNEEITSKLLSNCIGTLHANDVKDSQIQIQWVPGGFEIPWAAQEMALTKQFDAIICLGAILKGETTQNSYMAASTIHHLHDISLSTRVPCILGVLTPDTYEQAEARTKGELDRGRESALAALSLLREAANLKGKDHVKRWASVG
jgi:6,7-dimethyl-8-ribityllumazine synthase